MAFNDNHNDYSMPVNNYDFNVDNLNALKDYNAGNLFPYNSDTASNIDDPQGIENGHHGYYGAYGEPQEVQPMQQPVLASRTPAAPTPMFHPAIGWFYPAAAPAGVVVPPMPQEIPTALPAMPSTRKGVQRPASRQTKRPEQQQPTEKYVSDAEFFQKSNKKKVSKPNPKKSELEQKPNAKRLKASIIKACVCNKKATMKMPRPKNAFILYRSHHAKDILRHSKTGNYQHVSGIAGKLWNAESDAVKAKFYQLAAEEKLRHQELYPEYKYVPGGWHAARFGDENCKCGAYEINMQAMAAADAREQQEELEGVEVEAGPSTGVAPQGFQHFQPLTKDHATAKTRFQYEEEDEEYVPPAPKRTRNSPRQITSRSPFLEDEASDSEALFVSQPAQATTIPVGLTLPGMSITSTTNYEGHSMRRRSQKLITPLPTRRTSMPRAPTALDNDLFNADSAYWDGLVNGEVDANGLLNLPDFDLSDFEFDSFDPPAGTPASRRGSQKRTYSNKGKGSPSRKSDRIENRRQSVSEEGERTPKRRSPRHR